MAENIAFEIPAMTELADAADGSMRDALSLLDPGDCFCREQLRLNDVRSMLGNVEQGLYLPPVSALGRSRWPTITGRRHY